MVKDRIGLYKDMITQFHHDARMEMTRHNWQNKIGRTARPDSGLALSLLLHLSSSYSFSSLPSSSSSSSSSSLSSSLLTNVNGSSNLSLDRSMSTGLDVSPKCDYGNRTIQLYIYLSRGWPTFRGWHRFDRIVSTIVSAIMSQWTRSRHTHPTHSLPWATIQATILTTLTQSGSIPFHFCIHTTLVFHLNNIHVTTSMILCRPFQFTRAKRIWVNANQHRNKNNRLFMIDLIIK